MEEKSLEQQLSEAHATIRDLNRQLKTEREKLTVSQSEMDEYARIRQEHAAALAIQNEIALWLRENKAEEIRRGEHAGLGLAKTVIRYMWHSVPKKG